MSIFLGSKFKRCLLLGRKAMMNRDSILKSRDITLPTKICIDKWSEVKSLSRVWLFATPWTVAHQAPPSMEFSRQEYWSGLLFPSPGDPPDPGIEPGYPTLQADIYHLSHQGSPSSVYRTILVRHYLLDTSQLVSVPSYSVSSGHKSVMS